MEGGLNDKVNHMRVRECPHNERKDDWRRPFYFSGLCGIEKYRFKAFWCPTLCLDAKGLCIVLVLTMRSLG